MNTTSILKLIACLAWAGVAVSSATPASAYAATYDRSGYTYASCSANYTNNIIYCDYFTLYYNQTIKFVSTACSSGGCAGAASTYTDFVYSVGRKTATFGGPSCSSFVVYGLGSCAC